MSNMAVFSLLLPLWLSNILLPFVDKDIGRRQCVFREELLNDILHLSDRGEKLGNHQLLIGYKKPYNIVMGENMYSIFSELAILMKLVDLLKVRLNETDNKCCIVRCLCDTFPSQNAWKQEGALSSLISNFVVEYTIRRSKKTRRY
jgi:hypothetical protein